MAQKRSLLNAMPAVSTSEEDESPSEDEKQEQESKIKPKTKPESDNSDDEEEEEEEESEDEEEIEKAVSVKDKKPSVQKHSTVAAVAVPATPTKKLQSSSETDADDGSGSESDSGDTQQSPTASAFTIKPISSKPVVASSVSKKPASKSTSQVSSTPVKSTGKRLAETPQNGKDSKKSKVSEEADGKTEEKKSAITRVFSDKDEIAILDGMIRYKSEKGLDPTTDMMAFKEFLKDSIRADVSKSQLSEKIRRLKKKYLTNAEKGENGEDPALLKPHDYRIFELSKKIWGSSSTDTNAAENNGTSSAKKIKKIEPKEDSKSTVTVAELKVERVKEDEVMGDEKVGKDLCSVYPRLNEMFNIRGYLVEDTERFIKESINLIGSSKAKEMDEKWKKLQIEEFEVYSKRITLINEQNKLVLDALKSSKN